MWSGADASYLAAITAAAREYTWHGTLTDANGTAYSFSAEDIVKGSGQISKKVSSDTSLDIGTVYTSELTIRLYLSINRYVLFGGTIDLYCDVEVNGSTYSVPMGEYIISSCSQEMSCLSIVAYDAMLQLDNVMVGSNTLAEPYDWIVYILTEGGLTLGNTRNEIRSMPNGTESITFVNCNTDLESMSCRDALASICMILCANAYIGRDGFVYLKNYSMTAVDDLGANERFSSSFSDYTTNYTSVTLGVFESGTAEYYAETPDNGLNYSLGINPWMQDASRAQRENLCRNILTALNQIAYEPYTVTIPIRPELDPMDVLTFSGNQASSDKGAITSVIYKLGGAMTIVCSGENPRLASAKSKNDKDIAGLISAQELDKPRIFAYTNATAITIGDGDEETVAYLHVVAKKMTRFVLQLEVNHLAETTEIETASAYTNTDLNITGKVYINNVLQDFSPVEVEQDGTQGYFLTFTEQVPQQGMEVKIDLACSGGNISVAIGDVQAYLMGPGFDDFKIESITITSLPNNLFPYGLVNYDGLVIDGVFNDGSQLDVTDDCAITPSEGTAISGDAEVVHMTANYNNGQFTEEFDVPVNPLFITRGEQAGNLFNGSTLPDETIEVGDDVYALRATTANTGTSKSYTLAYSNFVLDADGRPTYPSVKSSFYSGFPADTASDYTFDVFRDGAKWYITSGRYWIDIVREFDFEALTDISVQPTFHDNGQYPSTIEGVRSSDHVLSGSDGLGFMLDGYMFYPDLGVKCTGQYTTIGSIGYGIIENGAVDIYLVRQARYTNVRTVDDLRATFTADGLKIERLHFNPIDLLTYEEIVTVPGVSGSSVWGWKIAGSANLYVFYDASTKVIVDASTGRFIVVRSSDDAFDLIDQRTTYDPDRGIYITMARDTEHQYTYRMHLMWFSHDLVTWFRGGYLAPVGMADAYDLNRSTNLAHLGDFLVGAVDPVDSYIAGFSVEFQTEV